MKLLLVVSIASMLSATSHAATQDEVKALEAQRAKCDEKTSNRDTGDCNAAVLKKADALMATVVAAIEAPLVGTDAHGRDQSKVRADLRQKQQAFLEYRKQSAELAAEVDGGTASDQYPVYTRAELVLTLQRIQFLDTFPHEAARP
jgi:uncharacterized protein YecT (DUF1311 family)